MLAGTVAMVVVTGRSVIESRNQRKQCASEDPTIATAQPRCLCAEKCEGNAVKRLGFGCSYTATPRCSKT